MFSMHETGANEPGRSECVLDRVRGVSGHVRPQERGQGDLESDGISKTLRKRVTFSCLIGPRINRLALALGDPRAVPLGSLQKDMQFRPVSDSPCAGARAIRCRDQRLLRHRAQRSSPRAIGFDGVIPERGNRPRVADLLGLR